MTKFNEKAIAETIKDYVETGTTLDEIQTYAFNSDPYIIGTYKASQALENFDESDQMYGETMLNGVFGAIEYVQNYENEEFGQVTTDLSDPEQLASQVAFINGDIVINDIMNEFELDWDTKLTDEDVTKINQYLEELAK